MSGRQNPTVVLFPEASFGSALNCVGIAQELLKVGAEPVFLTLSGFEGVYSDYGFREHLVPPEAPSSEAEVYGHWQAFLNRHLPHFNLRPDEQIDSYVEPVWKAIFETVRSTEAGLSRLLARIDPDLIVLDNVIMFPAIARQGCPWVRVVSCAETEIPGDNVPPYLSGLSPEDEQACQKFRGDYLQALKPVHDAYNAFRAETGLPELPPGIFLETSPDLNLLLAPSIVRRDRPTPLPEDRFAFLEGCVRKEQPYEVPRLPRDEGPLVYTSFGSLGAADVDLFKRLLRVFANIPARFLVNVGAQISEYGNVPDNVHLSEWFPQPSVVRQCDLFFHHGGNNSFCEALYFGVPSLIMPYCWDGHDNATRAAETGTGLKLDRFNWTEAALETAIRDLLADRDMRDRLKENAATMQSRNGARLAARKIIALDGSHP